MLLRFQAFYSPGWTVTAFSAFPCMTKASVIVTALCWIHSCMFMSPLPRQTPQQDPVLPQPAGNTSNTAQENAGTTAMVYQALLSSSFVFVCKFAEDVKHCPNQERFPGLLALSPFPELKMKMTEDSPPHCRECHWLFFPSILASHHDFLKITWVALQRKCPGPSALGSPPHQIPLHTVEINEKEKWKHSNQVLPVTLTLSPGWTLSTRSLWAKSATVCGVCPAGISSGDSCSLIWKNTIQVSVAKEQSFSTEHTTRFWINTVISIILNQEHCSGTKYPHPNQQD